MVSSNTECQDIITKLARMQMYHVTDAIFKYLDFKALRNAELAVEKWTSIIASGKLWEKFLIKKVFLSPDWENMLCVVKTVEPSLLQGNGVGPCDYRRACYLIAEKLTKQEHNWKHGITTKKKCSIRSAVSNTIAFDFNKQWALIGNGSKIIIRNRFNLEIEKELAIPIMQINISMIQLQEDPPKISLVKSNDFFIVTCFHGYPEVCVWSSASLDLLEVLDSDLYDGHSLSDDLMQWENYICLHGNSLLTIKWNGIEGGKICTMYRISTDPDVKALICFRETLLFQQEFVLLKDIVMDDKHILMLFILENDDGLEGEEEFFSKIEIRSASSFDVINTISLRTEVSHFHYLGGLISAGKLGGGWIKFWSTSDGQLEYRRKINHPYFLDGLKLINDKYLVTSDLTPYLRIWDLQKILNSDGLSGFLLYTIKPAQSFFRDGFDSVSMLADEFQIGLVAQFDRTTHILSVWDFIGDWDSPPSKKRKAQPLEDYDD